MPYLKKPRPMVRCCKCRAETEEWLTRPSRRGPACLLCIIRHAVYRGEPVTLTKRNTHAQR